MSNKAVFESFAVLDNSGPCVALDYQGTKARLKSMISEWHEATQGGDLFGVQTSVGAVLFDFGVIIGMSPDEIYQLLR